ncbi:MAG TPA: antibiotic biosynthesis monooxygenase [Rhizomicrobium sp.]|nr:antibiotic biosynthesis monooxygenase [Rhizomicrobium sp.]
MRRSGTSRDACNLMFWSPKVEGDRVLLHEIYSDKAAFDAHLQTEHFRVFNSASESWCLQKSVRRYGLVFSGANVASKRATD